MSRTFQNTASNKTFGQFKEPDDCGYYILNKKAKATFCSANVCTPSASVNTQGNYLLLKNSNALKYYNCMNSFNKANLNINLLTSLNLEDVDVVENVVNKTPGIGPYLNYIIDPIGELFGNTPCGLYNYTKYMVYNPPNSFPVPLGTNNTPEPLSVPAVQDLFVNGGTFTIESVPTQTTSINGDFVPTVNLPTNVNDENKITIYNICGTTVAVYSPNTIQIYNSVYAPNITGGTNYILLTNNKSGIFTYIYDSNNVCTIIGIFS
jgi:hypothetical protein